MRAALGGFGAQRGQRRSRQYAEQICAPMV
jgi:hypothetical protein